MKKPSAMRSTSFSAAKGESVRLSPKRQAAWGLAALVLLSCLLVEARAQSATVHRERSIAEWSPPRSIDKSRLARQGFRVLAGRHVTLVTDLPSAPAVDELPQVVDAAVPLLAERFGVEEWRTRDWQVLAMVLADRQRFAAAGLMPEGHQAFPDGLSMGYELWVADQPSDYYRRHLLLHELVHSFMATQLGGCGPGWYMEGMAELLGTHEWDSRIGKLTLSAMPETREAVPMWGRTKLVREAVAAGRLLPIAAVMEIDNRQALDVESYAWVWALAKFLDTHPRYQGRFRELQNHTREGDFDQRFVSLFADDRADLETEWRLFCTTLDYGHDIEREAIEFPRRAAVRRLVTPARIKVSATNGWQSTGLWLEGGEKYEIKASGRFVIGAEPDGTPWPCEAGGITLEYYAGEPLGKLLAVLDPRPVEGDAPATSAFLEPKPLGVSATLAAKHSGVLYLRLNDFPAALDDNRGGVTVSVRRVQ